MNHMSMMKTNLTTILMCPQERFALYKSSSRLILCYKKDWATLLHLCYNCYLLPATNYITTKLLVTDNFSAYKKYLSENCLSCRSAPRWVRHYYLPKGLWLIPYTCGSPGTGEHDVAKLECGTLSWQMREEDVVVAEVQAMVVAEAGVLPL